MQSDYIFYMTPLADIGFDGTGSSSASDDPDTKVDRETTQLFIGILTFSGAIRPIRVRLTVFHR